MIAIGNELNLLSSFVFVDDNSGGVSIWQQCPEIAGTNTTETKEINRPTSFLGF